MRLLHTADWHLGQELYGFDRTPEFKAFLDWLVAAAIESESDAILVAGDVFHSVNPPAQAVQQFYDFLREMTAAAPDLPLVIIGGNHDSAARLELPTRLLGTDQLFIVGGLPRRSGEVDLHGCIRPLLGRRSREVEAVVAAIPYPRPGDLGGGENPVTELYDTAMAHAKTAYPGLPVILMGHIHVVGGAVSEMSERRILVGGVEAVGPEVFPETAAYVALGHLHRPQTLGARRVIRYSGSPLALSSSERAYARSVTLVEFANGETIVNEIPVPRWVPFLRVPERGSAPLEDVESQLRSLESPAKNEHGPPFLEISVALETAEPDLRARIEAAIGERSVRLGRIQRSALGDAQGEAQIETETVEDLSPTTLFAELHAQLYGQPPPSALIHALVELIAAQDPTLTYPPSGGGA